jgi:IS1 family transposase
MSDVGDKVTRIADVSINTVTKLLVNVGAACEKFHNDHVVAVNSKRIQCNEIWSFVYAKEKNKPADMDEAGDVWTWTAIDADSKLIISSLVGDRSGDSANEFIRDVSRRVTNRVQICTDGLFNYVEAVTDAFGSQVDFAQLVKIYGKDDSQGSTEKKYRPTVYIGAKKNVISGNPDPAHISTSYVERQNLTTRMHMRRFTRLTNAFSKKVENHCNAIALHFVYYNFIKQHKTLRITPAMAAGITKRFMSIEEVVKLAD